MTQETKGPPIADLSALERFIVDNSELLDLESRIGRFNIFDALDIANAEIRHSKFLSFILDPAESHGQSQLFLRAVLMDLLKRANPDLRPFSPIEVDGADLRGVVVRSEWNNIDLLITCENPSFVVAIENKIWSGEHSNQLFRYEEIVHRFYPNARQMFVFLTPDGSEASESSWISYSYQSLHSVLSRVRKTYANAIGNDVRVFLDHYLGLIGTRLMNDKDIDQLCAQIYKNHRQAIELIYQRGKPTSGALAIVAEILNNEPDRWHLLWKMSNYVDFVPKSWLDWLPKIGLDETGVQGWFALRFEVYDGALSFYTKVFKTQDVQKRREIIASLIDYFQNAGFKRKQTGKISDSYTQVSGYERLLELGEHDENLEQVQKVIKAKLDEIYPKLDGVRAALSKVIDVGQ